MFNEVSVVEMEPTTPPFFPSDEMIQIHGVNPLHGRRSVTCTIETPGGVVERELEHEQVAEDKVCLVVC